MSPGTSAFNLASLKLIWEALADLDLTAQDRLFAPHVDNAPGGAIAIARIPSPRADGRVTAHFDFDATLLSSNYAPDAQLYIFAYMQQINKKGPFRSSKLMFSKSDFTKGKDGRLTLPASLAKSPT